MTAPRIRADYDALRQLSASWRQQASETNRSVQQLRSRVVTLHNGDWIGNGATAFYREMNDQVLPALARLADALSAAGDTTQKISVLMKQAEDEAASCFKADGAAGAAVLGAAGAALGAAAGAAGALAAAAAAAALGAASGLGAAAGAAGALAAAAAAAANAAREKAVQTLIDKGDHDGAIKEAIKLYGIDVSAAKGTPSYDSSTPGEGGTSPDGTIKIGDDAFSSPGWLASSVGHEHVHAQQVADRWYTGTQGTHMNEVEAYDWELANAKRNNLSTAEVAELQRRRRDDHYNELTPDNRKIVDGGSYKLPAGETDT